MDNILDILGVGASVASGGLFGLLGSVFSWWSKQKERKLRLEEKREEWRQQKELIQLQQQSSMQQGSWQGLAVSLQDEATLNSQPNYRWVIAVKSLFRPFITTFLWVMVGFEAYMLLTGRIDSTIRAISEGTVLFDFNMLQVLVKYIIYSTVFCAVAATLWWFGERAVLPPELKNR